jgi:hypothetical protein
MHLLGLEAFSDLEKKELNALQQPNQVLSHGKRGQKEEASEQMSW